MPTDRRGGEDAAVSFLYFVANDDWPRYLVKLLATFRHWRTFQNRQRGRAGKERGKDLWRLVTSYVEGVVEAADRKL